MAEARFALTVPLPPRALGGHEQALLGWLRDAQRLHGLALRLVCGDAVLMKLARQAGLEAELLPNAGSRLSWVRLLRQLRPRSPLLLAPGGMYAQAWLLAAALALGHRCWVYVPMSVGAQRAGYRWARSRDLLLRPWLRHVAGWITVSEEQADGLRLDWALSGPVCVLPAQAIVDEPAPAIPVHQADGGLRIAVVGRFDLRQKGLDWLVDTVQAVGDPRDRWRIQGRGDGEHWLRQRCHTSSGRLSLHAHAPLVDALAVSDLLLLSSRYEGVPLVALEATRLGWPVVATRQSGLGRLLPESSLFEFGDATGMATALQRLRDPAARRTAVAIARRRLANTHAEHAYRRALRRVVTAMATSLPLGRPA